MPELIAKGPFDGQAERTKAGVTLTPLAEGPLWSVALFPGGAKGAAKALKTLGLVFPVPGTWAQNGEARIVWTGRDQALLSGPLPGGLDGHAAVTDQSGGWAGIALSGPAARAALARLVALDLRPAVFGPGQAARCGLNHVPAVLICTGAETFELRVFRSMARTAWHELAQVQDHLEARAG